MGVKYLYSNVLVLCFQILLRLYVVLETAQVQRSLDRTEAYFWPVLVHLRLCLLNHARTHSDGRLQEQNKMQRRIEVRLSALFDRKEKRIWLMVGRPRVITASRLSCSSRTLFLIWR